MRSAALTDLVIAPGSTIAPALLTAFYDDQFPNRPIVRHWTWLYRSGMAPFPLVMLDGDTVAAHAGGIPFTARVDGRTYRAAWFVDFVARPAYRRRGLGARLSDAWMKRSDLCVTFCNELSLRIFRRAGWEAAAPTELHTIWLRPFDHPRLHATVPETLRRVSNSALRQYMAALFRYRRASEPALQPLRPEHLSELVDVPAPHTAGSVEVVRDLEYFKWRIASSPDRTAYRVYRDESVTMVVKVKGTVRESVDVLFMSRQALGAPAVARRMLASLALWASNNGCACLRYCPPAAPVMAPLRFAFSQIVSPTFAYWSPDDELLRRLRTAAWHWQLLDSDFEWI